MGVAANIVRAVVNQPGRIHAGKDRTICVTFSVYEKLQSVYGFCRVSDGSNVLHELFIAGAPVLLTSPELEATIRLTAIHSFEVIGPIREKTLLGPFAHTIESHASNGPTFLVTSNPFRPA